MALPLLAAATVALDGLDMHRAALTAAECEHLVTLFQTLPAESDDRSTVLLPNMEGDFHVRRTNRFDTNGTLMASGAIDFVYDRLLSQPHGLLASLGGLRLASADELRRHVAFNLLHEFTHESGEGRAPEFGWHADTKPGDGKSRSLNVNVMLSARTEYGGGDLQVGLRPWSCNRHATAELTAV